MSCDLQALTSSWLWCVHTIRYSIIEVIESSTGQVASAGDAEQSGSPPSFAVLRHSSPMTSAARSAWYLCSPSWALVSVHAKPTVPSVGVFAHSSCNGPMYQHDVYCAVTQRNGVLSRSARAP